MDTEVIIHGDGCRQQQIMGVMVMWEYAELNWSMEGNLSTWYGPDGEKTIRSQPGLVALRLASQDGWEAVGYSVHGNSTCLLRRASNK